MVGKKISAVLILVLGLAGCGVIGQPRPTPAPLDEEARVRTAAAQTVSALGTQLASGENPAFGAPTHTVTPIPTRTLWPTATATAEPFTSTPQPESDPDATATATIDAPCNQAKFGTDVTIPDDSTIPPNTVFTKTWELENSGSCAWTADYAVVFAGRGTSMSGPAASTLGAENEIQPGEKGRVSVTLRAPSEPGVYEGYWMMRSADDKTFGTGPNASAPFYVRIRVAENYDFAEHWCSAEWEGSAGELPCPGERNETRGYMEQLKDPTLEDNSEREGLALLAVPQPVHGGSIAAHFPPVMVPEGADFRSTLSCQPGANGCYVRFKVTYRLDGGEEQILGEWNEGSEGGLTEAVRDLDMLAGRSAAFSLYVIVNGTPEQAKAIWFNPRIVK